MAEERKKLGPTEEMRVVEFLVAEWRKGKETPASALTEIRRGLDEGFPKWRIEKAGVLVTYSQELVTPPNVCPVCGKTVAGGPDEYLGHIKTYHPEEWRKLETDPTYTLVRKVERKASELKRRSRELLRRVREGTEDGILRCRFCGAPYAYRENLELHERGCKRK